MQAEPLLAASGLTVAFGGVRAVSNVSFDLRPQEPLCIIGPNGAGKSTLLNILSGAQMPDSGALELDGREMVGQPLHQFCRSGIVRKFQGANVFLQLPVRDNLIVAGVAVELQSGVAMPDPNEILDTLKIAPQARLLAGAISHGQRQWLEVGMTLMCRPRVLLLDEPTAGMTIEGAEDMATLMGRLRERCAVVIIEHNMNFVRAMNCRTLVMHQGELIGDGDFVDLQDNAEIRNVYLGRSVKSYAQH
jgi:branched-chain amino acid transport system ATP-binding protein